MNGRSDDRSGERRVLDSGRLHRADRGLRGEWFVLSAAVAVLVISAASLSQTLELRGLRATDAARSALTNCQATESIKREIRAVLVQASRRRQADSKDLRKARADAIARFSATDCYALPIVKAAGLRRPAARKSPAEAPG